MAATAEQDGATSRGGAWRGRDRHDAQAHCCRCCEHCRCLLFWSRLVTLDAGAGRIAWRLAQLMPGLCKRINSQLGLPSLLMRSTEQDYASGIVTDR